MFSLRFVTGGRVGNREVQKSLGKFQKGWS